MVLLAAGLGGKGIALSDQAAAAGASRARPGTQAGYEHSTEHRINAFDKSYLSNEKQLIPTGPTSEVKAKRLKLMFLLMMSLGPYRTPVR